MYICTPNQSQVLMYVLCKKNKIPKLYTLVQLVNFFFDQMSFLELQLEFTPSYSRYAL